jgi:hypothetical protein
MPPSWGVARRTCLLWATPLLGMYGAFPFALEVPARATTAVVSSRQQFAVFRSLREFASRHGVSYCITEQTAGWWARPALVVLCRGWCLLACGDGRFLPPPRPVLLCARQSSACFARSL